MRCQLRPRSFLLPVIEAKWAQNRLQLFRSYVRSQAARAPRRSPRLATKFCNGAPPDSGLSSAILGGDDEVKEEEGEGEEKGEEEEEEQEEAGPGICHRSEKAGAGSETTLLLLREEETRGGEAETAPQ